MKPLCRRIISMFLAVLTLITLLPVHSHAASVTYYQTSKASVPIWSEANSKSTQVMVISTAGTVLQVNGSTVNSSNNLWYRLTNGYWVFSGNVTAHSHSYTGGICNGNGCGYEWPYSVSSASGTYQVTNTSGAKIWTRPYSNKSTQVRLDSYGATVTVTGKTTNQEGNSWFRLSDGYWAFSGNVSQRFTISYNANGGSGAPGTQYVLSGASLKISSTKPTRAAGRPASFRPW